MPQNSRTRSAKKPKLTKIRVVFDRKAMNEFINDVRRYTSHASFRTQVDMTGRPQLKKTEVVNHPEHYGGDTTYEVIKVIEAWGLDKSFNLGNAVKYVARAGKKAFIAAGQGGDYSVSRREDLKKAAWYLNREIENLDKRQAIFLATHCSTCGALLVEGSCKACRSLGTVGQGGCQE